MKRVTVSLPDELAAALENEARMHRISKSQYARECVEEHFQRLRDIRVRVPFYSLTRSGHTDTSERFDEILAEIMEARFKRKMGRD